MNSLSIPARLLLVLAAACFTTAAFGQDADNKPKPAAPPQPPPIPKYPEPDVVLAAMKKASAYFRSNLSTAGGYASSWPRDISESHTENRSGPALISIQPPGTPNIGQAMLDAHLASGDTLFLQGAREAAGALLWCQYASGGWSSEFNFEPKIARRYHYRRDIDADDHEPGKRSRRSTLDDNKTQSALRFLMHFANSPAGSEDSALRHALDFAWDGLLAAQAPNGGWPQHFSGPADVSLPVINASFPAEWSRIFLAVDYTAHYTLNDNNLLHLMRLLLEAHQVEKNNNERFLDAAKRLGGFLLLAQMPDPQPVWAQQYDHNMHPAWARKFEPPAVCSIESFGAMLTLHELWLVTGDDKYIATLPAALKWLNDHQLEDGQWARFYELQTNRPLYCEAETYLVTYDDSNTPTHYGYKTSGSFGRSIDKLKETLTESREDILARLERQTPDSEKAWSERARKGASKARDALKQQKKEGYWLKDDLISAGEFMKHMKALTDYYDAAGKGGDTFSALRSREIERERQAAAAAKAAEQK